MAEFAGESLSVKIVAREGALIVAPMGDVDLTASPTLRQELKKAQATKPQRLIVDLAAVPYMDSSGVATLVEAMQQARRNNTRMVLSGLSDRVRSIFEIARLDTVFSISQNTDDAMTA